MKSMPRAPLIVLLLTLAAGAHGGSLERVSRLLERGGFAMPDAADVPRPRAAALARASLQEWEALPKPDPRVLDWLASRIPGLDREKVRELPMDASIALLAAAADKGQSAVDLFTDASLRTDKIYYMSQRSLAAVDDIFELNSLFPFKGVTLSDKPFVLQASVMGANKIHLLYNRDNFVFRHPLYTDYGGKYQFRSRVLQTIEGPGRLGIEGVWGPWNAVIEKIILLSPKKVKVVTNVQDGVYPVAPVRRRKP